MPPDSGDRLMEGFPRTADRLAALKPTPKPTQEPPPPPPPAVTLVPGGPIIPPEQLPIAEVKGPPIPALPPPLPRLIPIPSPPPKPTTPPMPPAAGSGVVSPPPPLANLSTIFQTTPEPGVYPLPSGVRVPPVIQPLKAGLGPPLKAVRLLQPREVRSQSFMAPPLGAQAPHELPQPRRLALATDPKPLDAPEWAKVAAPMSYPDLDPYTQELPTTTLPVTQDDVKAAALADELPPEPTTMEPLNPGQLARIKQREAMKAAMAEAETTTTMAPPPGITSTDGPPTTQWNQVKIPGMAIPNPKDVEEQGLPPFELVNPAATNPIVASLISTTTFPPPPSLTKVLHIEATTPKPKETTTEMPELTTTTTNAASTTLPQTTTTDLAKQQQMEALWREIMSTTKYVPVSPVPQEAMKWAASWYWPMTVPPRRAVGIGIPAIVMS